MAPTPKKQRPLRGRPADAPEVRAGHAARLDRALKAILGATPNQSEAARRTGLTPGRINDVLNRHRALGRADLSALARGLKISADYLLGVPGAPMFVAERLQGDVQSALAQVVAARVAERVAEPWIQAVITERIDGARLLARFIALADEDVTTFAAFLDRWAQVGAELRRVYGPNLAGAPGPMYDAMGEQMTSANGFIKPGPKTYQMLATRILEAAPPKERQQRTPRTSRRK